MTIQSGQNGLGGKKAHMVLIVLTLLYMINYMDRSLLSVVLEPLKQELGLSDTQAGSLQTIFLFSVGIFMMPCAVLIDRWSRRKGIALMAIIWSIAVFCIGLSRQYGHAAASLCLIGIGEAGFVAGGVAWLSNVFPSESRSKSIGIFNVGIPLGSAIGVILGGAIATKTGNWRLPFYIFSIPGILLGIICFFLHDYQTEEKGFSKSYFKEIAGFFKIKSYVFTCIGLGLWIFALITLTIWMPALLMRTYGLSEEIAGRYAGLVSVLAIAGAPFGGVMADRWQKKSAHGRMLWPALATLVATVSMGLFLSAFGSSIILLGVTGVIFGVLAVSPMPALMTCIVDVVVPRLHGAANGLSGVIIFGCFASWGPVLTGKLSDVLGGGAGGLKYALFCVLPAGFLSSVFIYIGSKNYAEARKKVELQIVTERN